MQPIRGMTEIFAREGLNKVYGVVVAIVTNNVDDKGNYRVKVRFPWLFLVKCKLTVNRFKKTIDPRFPAEMIDMCALPLWVYINLKRQLGPKAAFEIMRVANPHRRHGSMELRLSRRRRGSYLREPLQ